VGWKDSQGVLTAKLNLDCRALRVRLSLESPLAFLENMKQAPLWLCSPLAWFHQILGGIKVES
jgi:hypothetical protein